MYLKNRTNRKFVLIVFLILNLISIFNAQDIAQSTLRNQNKNGLNTQSSTNIQSNQNLNKQDATKSQTNLKTQENPSVVIANDQKFSNIFQQFTPVLNQPTDKNQKITPISVIHGEVDLQKLRTVTISTDNKNKSAQKTQKTVNKNQKAKANTKKIIDKPYKRIYQSQNYYKVIQQMVFNLNKLRQNAVLTPNDISNIQIVNATHLANGKQICLTGIRCQFFYYIISPKIDKYHQTIIPNLFTNKSLNNGTEQKMKQINPDDHQNMKTVLYVSGMHGNQYLGPTSLLYSLHHLALQSTTKNTRIIVFPLANPSGFDRKQRETYPTRIDPNRDFPIQKRNVCYQASSTLIIDFLYRNFDIDFTIGLHNGQSQIGWNWGTVRQSMYPKGTITQSNDIYQTLGQWLKYMGGSNPKISMEQFRIGTMSDVIYPAEQTFDDWAYAGSWYDKKVLKQEPNKFTQKCRYPPYPQNMHHGLVFLMQLGPFDVPQQHFGSEQGLYLPPNSQSPKNGYITRTVRMLTNIIKVMNPTLLFKFTNNQLIVKLQGCKFGKVNYLRIYPFQQIGQDQRDRNYIFNGSLSDYPQLFLKGDIANSNISKQSGFQQVLQKLVVFKLNKNLYQRNKEIIDIDENNDNPQKFVYKNLQLVADYQLVCDQQWQGKGHTIFAQGRRYRKRESLFVRQAIQQLTTQNDDHSNDRRTLYPTVQSAKQSFVQNVDLGQVQFVDQDSFNSIDIGSIGRFFSQNSKFIWIVLFILIIAFIIFYAIFLIVRQIKRDLQVRRLKKLKMNIEQSHLGLDGSGSDSKQNKSTSNSHQLVNQTENYEDGQNSFQQEGPSMSLSTFKPIRPNKQIIQLPSTSQVNYPQFCQSDKSMKNQEQILQLQQFVNMYGDVIEEQEDQQQ